MKTIFALLIICALSINAQSQCNPPVLWYDGCDLEVVDNWKYVHIQWYKWGVPIPGATEFTYEPYTSGSYGVRTLESNGCIRYSERYQITNWCGVEKLNNPDTMKTYSSFEQLKADLDSQLTPEEIQAEIEREKAERKLNRAEKRKSKATQPAPEDHEGVFKDEDYEFFLKAF